MNFTDADSIYDEERRRPRRSWSRAGRHFLTDWNNSKYSKGSFVQFVVVLAILVFVIVGSIVARVPRHVLATRYREKALAAFSSGDFARAELFSAKLATVGVLDASIQFGVAMIAEQAGNYERAERLVHRLLATFPDFGPANLWLARRRISALGNPPDREELTIIDRHLSRVLATDPESADVLVLLAQVANLRGNPGAAIGFLERLAGKMPEVRLQIARLYAAQGISEQSSRFAEEHVRYYQARIAQNSADTSSRLHCASGLAFLARWHEAEQILRAGLGGPDEDRIRPALADHYCQVSDYLMRVSPENLPQSVEALLLAYSTHSQYPGVAARSVRFVTADVKLPKELVDQAVEQMAADLAAAPNSPDLKRQLAQAYQQLGQFDKAISILSSSSGELPETQLRIAFLQKSKGDRVACRETALNLKNTLEKQLSKRSKDVGIWLLWAEATVLLEEWDLATERLRILISAGDNADLRNALANIFVRRSEEDSSLSSRDRMQLIRRALSANPDHRASLGGLLRLSQSDKDLRSEALDVMRKLLVRTHEPVLVHCALGLALSMSEDWQSALIHLEQAHRAYPADISILNNLAWCLAHISDDPIELARAAELADRAVRESPGSVDCRATRGFVAVRRRQWSDAIEDLERVLVARPETRSMHSLLAEAYQEIGQTEIADLHRQQAAVPVAR